MCVATFRMTVKMEAMFLTSGPPRTLGVAEGSVLRFDRENGPEDRFPGRRLLFLRDEPAFELSHWCGTCPILFKRLAGANETLSMDDLVTTLTEGLTAVDDAVVDAFGALLPRGSYLPMLLSLQPRFVNPGRPGDYFSDEQVASWGVDQFWGLPEYPQTPYYRTWQTAVDDGRHLYEFVVPMVPPSWNDPERVDHFDRILASSSTPTAVAVTVLDVAQAEVVGRGASDHYEHWGLTHFLLDGHHKMEAAARSCRLVQLLSLFALDFGVSRIEDAQRIPELRSLRERRRGMPRQGT